MGYWFLRNVPTDAGNRLAWLHGGSTSLAINANRHPWFIVDFGGTGLGMCKKIVERPRASRSSHNPGRVPPFALPRQEAFRDVDRSIQLHVASVGAEAMALLRHSGVHIHAPGPDLTLLDLSLPKMDGREVLAQIKEDASLRTNPRVTRTTSEAEADIVRSHQLQGNCYLSKPAQLDAFERVVKSINDFWLTKAKLPQQRQNG